MCMVWNKQLSIGNSIVDSEHKHLIGLTNHVEHAMRGAMDTKDGSALQQAFELMEYELRRHFLDEEKVARALNIPFEQHRTAQQHMLSDIHFLKTELMTKDCIWTEAALRHFVEFLEDLITEHITRADLPLKSALRGYDYDFWPDRDMIAARDAEPVRRNPVTPPWLAMHA